MWMNVDRKGELVDSTDYGALTHLGNARKLGEYSSGADEPNSATVKRLADKLLSSYRKKLIRIKNNRNFSFLDKQDRVYAIIIAFRVALSVFPKDSRFCDYPIQELSEIETNFKWIDLSYKGNLISHRDTSKIESIDAVEMLRFFYKYKYGNEDWILYKQELLVYVSQRLYEIVNQRYNRIGEYIERLRIPKHEYYVIKESPSVVDNVEDCILGWISCYKILKSEEIRQKLLKELSGSGYFFHFGIDSEELSFISDFLFREYHAEKLIGDLLDYDLDLFKRGLNTNYFDRFIKSKYDYISNKSNRILNSKSSKILISLFHEAFKLMGCLEDNRLVFNFLKRELFEETNHYWLDITEDGLKLYSNVDASSSSILLSIVKSISAYFDDTGLAGIENNILENRKFELDETYENDFSSKYKKNDNVSSVNRMVELINRFLIYFDASKDLRFLEVPIIELIELKGKISWYFQFPPKWTGVYPLIKIPKSRNKDIENFDLNLLVKEVSSRLILFAEHSSTGNRR